MGQLIDKVVLVTGAASGIGRACCLAFAREGAKVVAADINAEGGEKTIRIIKERGGECIFVMADVTDKNHIQSLLDRTLETYGRLDCAMNNAGILGKSFNITEWDEDDWDRVIQFNLKSVWLCMKYELPHMLDLGKGVIVNTASTAGIVASMRSAAYSASKHGLVGLTKASAVAYARMGIRINALCPGVTDTPLIANYESDKQKSVEYMKLVVPAQRMGTSEEQAQAAVWLLSDASSYVTGHCLIVDGGLTVW